VQPLFSHGTPCRRSYYNAESLERLMEEALEGKFDALLHAGGALWRVG
jgi:hypothetical protein